ncbi:hypothetical protein SAMN05216489_03443 [Streptomyces sp. 3213]|nr:hypothetical protein SAMN05216489_03443 [Streptomyces sp. 3213] [Streptomyces sp. 3213.3]
MGPQEPKRGHLPNAAGPGRTPGPLPDPRRPDPLAKYGVKGAGARRAGDSPTEVPS